MKIIKSCHQKKHHVDKIFALHHISIQISITFKKRQIILHLNYHITIYWIIIITIVNESTTKEKKLLGIKQWKRANLFSKCQKVQSNDANSGIGSTNTYCQLFVLLSFQSLSLYSNKLQISRIFVFFFIVNYFDDWCLDFFGLDVKWCVFFLFRFSVFFFLTLDGYQFEFLV